MPPFHRRLGTGCPGGCAATLSLLLWPRQHQHQLSIVKIDEHIKTRFSYAKQILPLAQTS